MTQGHEADTTSEGVAGLLDRIGEWEHRAESVGRESVDARVNAGRARIETLRMQVHLAAMDGRDGSEMVVKRLETGLADTRERLLELAQEATDVWTVFSEAIESARAELGAGEELIEDRLDVHRAGREPRR
jgi:hypothetical protein